MSKTIYLYSRDKKGKIRVLILEIKAFENNYERRDVFKIYAYHIIRKSGLLDGKLTQQPTLIISKGKAGRTLQQQVDLEVNSIINKQKDKGYVLLEDLNVLPVREIVNPMNYNQIDARLPKLKTYVNGFQKVMLAKDPKPGTQWFKNGKPTSKWDRRWQVSRKLDGIRSSIVTKEDVFHSYSRTGKSLDVAFTKIFKDIDLLKVSQILGEDIMIDGELYVHGMPLQKIAGIAALKDWDEARHGQLEFWIFDYAGNDDDATTRANKLNSISLKGTTIRINKQYTADNYDIIKAYHDKWVMDGYEGAIARDGSKQYGYDARDERMVKLKEFQDDEFEIVGHKLGLRGSEDMCFICKTPDGKTFEPPPIGDRAQKAAYVADMPNLIGKMGTVRFFNYTVDGVPGLPKFVAVRNYE
jgi:hypothetical protein